MIRREDIRELAQFESKQGCALSFYFQPQTPQNKSHREEAILAKDLVQNALREAGKDGKHRCARADLDRIIQVAEALQNDHSHAKAVFASSKQGFWREFDLPPLLSGSSLALNRRFHLRPLARVLSNLSHACVALVDRQLARFFELSSDEIEERKDIKDNLPRRRSDGFAGYDAGHIERHVEHEAMHHFKNVAERLKALYDIGTCENFIIGCRDETWPEIEPHLHPYVREHLVGRFAADTATASLEEVRDRASEVFTDHRNTYREAAIREAIGEARRDGRGAVGLRHVLNSLEMGEVQTLLLGDKFQAPGSECTNCGHLDFHPGPNCAICDHPTSELSDISDALVGKAVRNRIRIIYVEQDPEFEKVGHIAVLLRFRADQNTNLKQAGD